MVSLGRNGRIEIDPCAITGAASSNSDASGEIGDSFMRIAKW
jgi:hypothetical protein